MASLDFAEEEIKIVNNALDMLEQAVGAKLLSLTPQQRQQYGRVKYEKEIFIDKAFTYMEQMKDLVPRWVDTDEFKKDYTAHKTLNQLIPKVESLLNRLQDTNLLLGYDLDTAALAFYQNIKMASKMNEPGARTTYEDMKQQFPGMKGKKSAENQK